MKIAFIENRYKTYFWLELAKVYRSWKHEVVWLVQNTTFTPDSKGSDRTTIIPYPKRKQLNGTPSTYCFDTTVLADRNINYFGGNTKHYHHYYLGICAWLDRERPTFVIGESTLFHELLVIQACKERKIPYLNPSMTGYPGQRFSIYTYDTKEPIGTNPRIPNDGQCLEIAESIRKRERIPEYMRLPTKNSGDRKHPLPRSIGDRALILKGYFGGEHYNTPSPLRKWRLDRQVKTRLIEWERISKQKTTANRPAHLALYPMQLQPESNLDVWGQPFKNQTKLIKELADELPAGWSLFVKLNPKAKYEITDELLELVRDHPRILPLPLRSDMASVLEEVHLIFTVTGTIAVEAVLSRKPLVQFGPSIVNGSKGCVVLDGPQQAGEIAHSVETGRFDVADDSDRIDLVKSLYSTTFEGRVADPASLPSVMQTENVLCVAKNILDVAHSCA